MAEQDPLVQSQTFYLYKHSPRETPEWLPMIRKRAMNMNAKLSIQDSVWILTDFDISEAELGDYAVILCVRFWGPCASS